MKTYTAASGYVYQYYFVGKRAALDNAPEAPAVEYVFDVSPDRKATYAVSVFVKPSATNAWQNGKGRALSDTEQYAAAKMRLLRGFDEAELIRSHVSLVVDGTNVGELLGEIGVE